MPKGDVCIALACQNYRVAPSHPNPTRIKHYSHDRPGCSIRTHSQAFPESAIHVSSGFGFQDHHDQLVVNELREQVVVSYFALDNPLAQRARALWVDRDSGGAVQSLPVFAWLPRDQGKPVLSPPGGYETKRKNYHPEFATTTGSIDIDAQRTRTTKVGV